MASTTITPKQREQLGAVLHVDYMSTEESAEESGEDEHMGERFKVLIVHTVPWRSARVVEIFQSLDRKIERKRTSRAVEMCRHGREPPSTKNPPPSCPASWAKVPDC